MKNVRFSKLDIQGDWLIFHFAIHRHYNSEMQVPIHKTFNTQPVTEKAINIYMSYVPVEILYKYILLGWPYLRKYTPEGVKSAKRKNAHMA